MGRQPDHRAADAASIPTATSAEWKGRYVPYDIVKEAFVAFLAVAVLIVLSWRSCSRHPTSPPSL